MAEYFNTRFSILKFFRDVIATPFDLPLFCNDPKLPEDEAAMLAAEKYLFVTINDGTYDILQPIDVMVGLYQIPAFDATGNWIRVMGRQIQDLLIETKTDSTLNLVALYDYDAEIGAAALAEFLDSGAYPADIEDILAMEPGAEGLQPYAPGGITTGFLVIPERRTPVLRLNVVPYEMIFRLTFRYHDAGNIHAA